MIEVWKEILQRHDEFIDDDTTLFNHAIKQLRELEISLRDLGRKKQVILGKGLFALNELENHFNDKKILTNDEIFYCIKMIYDDLNKREDDILTPIFKEEVK